MMDEVERNIRRLSDGDLLEMVRVDFDEYTDEALYFAHDELRKRGIPEREQAGEEETQAAPAQRGGLNVPSGREGLLSAFLSEELKYEESYEALINFVGSMSIRSGEFEGSKFVVRKMDRDNFILYAECIGESSRAITACSAIGREELIEKITAKAGENGFVESAGEPEE